MTSSTVSNYENKQYLTAQHQFPDDALLTVVGTGTVADNADTTYIKTGTNSVSVLPDAGATLFVQITENFTAPNGRLGLWVYVENHENLKSTGGINIYLGNVTSIADGFLYSYVPQYNGWHFLQLTAQDWTTLGAGTWDSPIVRWRFRVDAAPAANSTVYLDSFYINEGRARGNVLLTFDDGSDSQYDTARAIINSANLKATFNVVGSLIDTAGFMTLAELNTLKSDGHAICVHGASDLSGLSIAAATADVQANIDYVSAIDAEGAKHYVWPNGVFEFSATDTQLVDMLLAKGIKTARTTGRNGIVTSTIKGLNNPMTLSISGHNRSLDTLQGMKDSVDLAYITGATIIFMFHKIVASGSTDTEMDTADFQAFIDHLQYRVITGRIKSMTVPEWYNGLASSGRSDR